jgi:peptidoglycan/xylan/chitin deacetylase (PgdA/CDA1 family)
VTIKKKLYDLLPVGARAVADRARFALGALPRVQAPAAGALPAFPEPHRACLTISADLELAWAWRYSRSSPDPGALALELAGRTRANMPGLLDVFRAADAPVTWATVGHLFLESCAAAGGRPHPEIARLPYFEHDLWSFRSGDWFDDDPCSDARRDPAWYAPDILDAIVAADPRHEIGCHSFSHIDFSDGICPHDVARDELRACVGAARARGMELETLVFPGNRSGNLSALREAGFAGYRVHTRDHLGLPRRDEQGMWQVPGGICWERPPGWSARSWIAALRRSLDVAAATGTVLHLWFHPSCERVNVDEVFPAVLDHAASFGDTFWRPTMRDIVRWCAREES